MATKHGSARSLLLLRHAQAVDFATGQGDHDRPLTDHGVEQATAVGAAIRSRGMSIDHVICSSAARSRQTFNALGLDVTCEFTRDAYNAGSDDLLALIRLLPELVNSAMMVGHGPGLPALAAQLAGPGSDQRAVDVLNSRYPTATLTCFDIDGDWPDLVVARLSWLRLGA